MYKKIVLHFLILFFMCGGQTFSRNSFFVKVMCWNLLNYPATGASTSADTALRHPFYRAVIQYAVPDILVTEENTFSTGTTWFLNSVMNANGNVYSKGTFIDGWDTNNEIYFKTASFTFVSNTPIRTDVRDISEFKLVHLLTGDTIRIYAVHLKASSGNPNDLQRADEVDSLRKVTNLLPPGSNFIVCGDFNIYGDYEPAYQKLLQNNLNDDGNFIDPITMTGVWHNYFYRSYHTQSTRTTSFGGGATGGLNDRFDMILFSTAIQQNTSGISYVASSTIPVGNDGNHYNDDINLMPNSAAPSIVINALYNASDHLPVFAQFNFSQPNGIASLEKNSFHFSVFPNPASDKFMVAFELHKTQKIMLKVIDILGKEVLLIEDAELPSGEYQYPVKKNLAVGIYLTRLMTGETELVQKLIILDN